jgi:hypothetical protein
MGLVHRGDRTMSCFRGSGTLRDFLEYCTGAFHARPKTDCRLQHGTLTLENVMNIALVLGYKRSSD